MPRTTTTATFAVLAVVATAMLLPATPAQSSEVVKLARLVITGKRLSADHRELLAVDRPVLQKLPTVVVEGESEAARQRDRQMADLWRRGMLRAL
jgi:hypothetical protein